MDFDKTYRFYQDAGHGWMAVRRCELDELGIADRISSYSYQRGITVYLEEDCDAKLFSDVYLEKYDRRPSVKYINHDGRSWIRSCERYVQPGVKSMFESI